MTCNRFDEWTKSGSCLATSRIESPEKNWSIFSKKKRLFNAKIGQNPSFLLVQRILDYWQFVCFQHCLMLLHYTEIVQN